MSSEISTSAPKPEALDYVYAAIKGALSLLPGGGVVTEPLSLLITSPLSKHHEQWISSLPPENRFLDLRMPEIKTKVPFRYRKGTLILVGRVCFQVISCALLRCKR